ncbi:MAG: circularly permuted type 2 ATP-grasp protein [Planctomycetaceae bacterium]
MHPHHSPAAPREPALSAAGPFAGYRPADGAYDELLGADGSPRPHWKGLVDHLGSWRPDVLANRWDQARRLIRDNGVTYAMQDEASGEQRPWVLDPIPLVIAAADWAALELGINQRARVLDALLADLYGPQHVLREGLVPPELVFGNPAFLRCCQGMPTSGGRRLHLYAAVVTRNRDGRWLAIGDRTDVPRGLGYALENRLVVSRLFPGAFEQSNVERLAPFFISLRTLLRALAVGRDEPRIVLQGSGSGGPTSFEEAYLARYLGYPLVEGGDLAVRDDRLWLKTLGGLVPLDVVLRRVADRDCDPLELDPAALEGTPGLVQVVRRGRVALANGLGSGLVESPAFAEYLPAVSRRLLGEDLVLGGPRSWWCGNPTNLQHVLDSLDGCVIEPVSPGRGPKRHVPALLTAADRERLVAEIRARPGDWVGRERVERSVAPCWNDGTIEPASLIMRCFAVAVPEGYQTMRGGLARMSTARVAGDELLLSAQGSKDVWVLADGPVAPLTLLRRPGQPVPLRRSGSDLPSRVADHLHWLGRHAERAENAARLLRTVAARLAAEADRVSAVDAALLLEAIGQSPSGTGVAAEGVRETIQSLVHDPLRDGSVRQEIDRLWRTASVVRDRISIDSWKVLARVRRDAMSRGPTAALPPAHVADTLPHLDALIFDLSAFAGLGTENMTRGPGWRFLDMGRRVERATFAIRLIGSSLAAPRPRLFADELGGDTVPLEEMLLEIADSSMTYRNRYPGVSEPAPLIDLLVIDETNPRSIAFQFAALSDHVAALPDDAANPVPSGERRAVMAALAQLRLADVERLAALDDLGGRRELAGLLGRLETLAREFADAISHRYLVHSTPRRQLGGQQVLPDVAGG